MWRSVILLLLVLQSALAFTTLGRICDEETLDMQCLPGEKINVIDVNGWVGGCDGTQPSTPCKSSTLLSAVTSRCEGKSKCSVTATDDVFGDSCAGTNRALEVKYMCSE